MMKQETIPPKRVRPPKRVKHVILRGGRRVSRPDGLTSYGVRVPHRADWGISRTWRRAAALKFALPLPTAQRDCEIPPRTFVFVSPPVGHGPRQSGTGLRRARGRPGAWSSPPANRGGVSGTTPGRGKPYRASLSLESYHPRRRLLAIVTVT